MKNWQKQIIASFVKPVFCNNKYKPQLNTTMFPIEKFKTADKSILFKDYLKSDNKCSLN